MRNETVAKGFLRVVLELEVDTITYLDTSLPSTSPSGRDFTVDVLCDLSDGRQVLLEMQNDYRRDYSQKALVELSRLIGQWDTKSSTAQADDSHRGSVLQGTESFWKNIHQVIVLVITNKEFSHSATKQHFNGESLVEPEIINTYRLMHDKHAQRHYGDVDVADCVINTRQF